MAVLVRYVRIRRVWAAIAAATLGILMAGAALAAIQLPTDKAALIELGKEHRTAWDLYKAFEAQASGGQRLNAARLPDWTGVYSRSGILFNWDQDQGRNRPGCAMATRMNSSMICRVSTVMDLRKLRRAGML
jgi:hypothetical protein